jgi:hypothetical protein
MAGYVYLVWTVIRPIVSGTALYIFKRWVDRWMAAPKSIEPPRSIEPTRPTFTYREVRIEERVWTRRRH